MDLVGPKARGLAVGLNESAGYLAVKVFRRASFGDRNLFAACQAGLVNNHDLFGMQWAIVAIGGVTSPPAQLSPGP